MPEEMPILGAEELLGGQILEDFRAELARVLGNCRDINTDPKTRRRITVAFEFAVDDAHRAVTITQLVRSTVAPAQKIKRTAYLSTDAASGEVIALDPEALQPGLPLTQLPENVTRLAPAKK